MLIAKFEDGTLCYANQYTSAELQEIRRQHQFYCPSCAAKVTLRVGASKIAHFAHQNKCTSGNEGETSEHLAGKLFLFGYCQRQGWTCALEAFLPKLQQRPDILVTLPQVKIALEFQCSPISIKQLYKRTEMYRQNGYQVYWLLGRRYHDLRHWSAKKRAFLRYSKQAGFHLFLLEAVQKRLWLVHHVRQYGVPIKVSYQRQRFLDNSFVVTNHRPPANAVVIEAQTIYKQLYRGAPNVQGLQATCYLAGHHLAGAPWACHSTWPTPPVHRESAFNLRVRLLLFCEKKVELTDVQVTSFCRQHKPCFFELPLLTKTQRNYWQQQVVRLLLAEFSQFGFLKRTIFGWQICCLPIWYPDYFSKLKMLKRLE
ncbi:competence protein CoiA [Loigolactobacillus iwatensis]|uniref:competence protein CoiA n=1 Tax=Loigolactobacillus iwatensis TaxID=1267156 RepID=UPI000F7DA648|nr:competence protein CoiA family protein [Loigolactobacillus iwatensis]